MRILWTVAAVIFVIDQVSKWIVVHYLDLPRVLAIDVLPPYLNLRMAWNTGINFGLLSGDGEQTRLILIAVAMAIVVFVLWWLWRDKVGRAGMIFGGLLIGGALGNVVDRLIYGAVADFLNMSCCGIDNPFAFNVADISIFAGALGLVFFADGKKPS